MRVALVGNGPTAREHRDAVNACDCVIRLNVPNMESGDKWDVWAANFIAELAPKLNGTQTPAIKWLCVPTVYAPTLAPNGLIQAEYQGAVTPEQWASLYFAAGCHRPTTGFVAMLLALEAGARDILLVGFDATVRKAPGWGSAHWDWHRDRKLWCMHDFAAEKRALLALQAVGLFAGKRYPVRIEWPGAPVPAEVRG